MIGPTVETPGVEPRQSPPRREDDSEEFDLPEISDVQLEAVDPTQFDQAFAARKGDFGVGGEISPPTSFPLEGIPRIAYVLNYNLLYDEDAGKWVPQKKSDVGDDDINKDGSGDSILLGILVAVGPDKSPTTVTTDAVDIQVTVPGTKSAAVGSV